MIWRKLGEESLQGLEVMPHNCLFADSLQRRHGVTML